MEGSRKEEYSKGRYYFSTILPFVIKTSFKTSSIVLNIYFHDWNYIKKPSCVCPLFASSSLVSLAKN